MRGHLNVRITALYMYTYIDKFMFPLEVVWLFPSAAVLVKGTI